MPDSLAMMEAARAMPEQFVTAVDAPSPLVDRPGASFNGVFIAGMGGSGIVGDVARVVVSPTSRIPVVTTKSDQCLGFIDENSLVIISSFSGHTAEAIGIMTEAIDRGATVVAVSTGGRVAELADEAGAPCWIVDGTIPCPRAALGALAVPVLRTLDHYGLFTVNDGRSLEFHLEATAKQLQARGNDFDREDNPAARLARRIGRTIPLIYGARALGEAAAIRWKSQFNENPKVPAFFGVVPELTHNEICGWAQHGDMTRQVLTLVQLRHSFEGDRNAAAMDIVGEITDEVVAGVHEVRAEGDGMLAQFFDLVMMGDFVSLHLALAEGIDPGPVPVLDDIKTRLR
ncbi:MAG: bifunctional phosphoglucose/phosphomannose isomerase [Microthrixaceae bacterium]|nr:bifunctional phosphoglucose/phosphomannose isomerase [Microthrixaceae bacterium]